MAVNVLGGALEFDARINLENFNTQLSQASQAVGSFLQKQTQQQELANRAQQEYARLIIQSGQSFKSLDAGIQSQIKELNALADELGKVRAAQDLLTAKKDLGLVGTDTAANSMAALINREKELAQQIDKLSQSMKANDAILNSASGSIQQQTIQLEQLKRVYSELSETDRIDVSIGGNILSQIQTLDSHLKTITADFTAVQKAATGSIDQKVQALENVKREYAALSAVDRNSDVGNKMLANFKALDAEVKVLNSSFQSIQQNAVGSLNAKFAELTRLKNDYAALSDLDRNGVIGRGLSQNIRGLDREINKINTELQETDKLTQRVSSAFGAYLSFQAATNFVQDIVRIRGEMQGLEIAFTTFLGSKERADKLLQEVAQFAAKTPFSLRDVADATKQMLAFGISADTVIDTIKQIGDVSAGIGAPLGEIAYLFGTIKTQGVALTQDVRQFASRGIPIYEELGKILKVDTAEVQKLIEAGKVGFPQIQQVFRNLTAEGGQFANLTAQMATSLSGQISNLSDAWEQMLNNIGKSNQGTFNSIIGTATDLVENYEKVIDILKLVALTYGSYRAALIITTLSQKANAAVAAEQLIFGNLLTASQARQAAVLVILDKAWKSLYVTISSFAPVAVLTALSVVIYSLTQTTNAAAQSQENLSNAISDGTKAAEAEKEKVGALLDVLKDKTRTHEDQILALNKLREATGSYLKGFTDEQILAGEAKGALDAYTESIYKNAVAKSARNTIAELSNQLADLDVKGIKAIGSFERLGESLKNTFGFGQYNKVGYVDQLLFGQGDSAIIANKKDGIRKQIADLKSTFKKELTDDLLGKTDDTKSGVVNSRTLQVIDAEIKAIKDEQSQRASSSKEFTEYQKKINALEKEREAITGKQAEIDRSKNLKAEETLENRINNILKERTDLLRLLDGIKNDARISGLVKEQSELDKVNEKYDNALLKIQDFNKKVEEFNKKNKTTVSTIGLAQINELNDSRQKELYNVNLKQQTELYIKNLADQKDIFEQYEQAKKQIGIEQASELFKAQTQGYKSHLDFLGAEFKKVLPAVLLGVADIGQVTKYRALGKAIQDENKKIKAQQQKDLIDILNSTQSFTEKRTLIDQQYTEKYKTLSLIRADIGEEEYDRRLQALQQNQTDEYNVLQAGLIRQSALYKKLNTDLITASREDLKKRIADLKKALKDGVFTDADGKQTDVTPQVASEIEGALGTAQNLINSTNKLLGMTGKELDDIAKKTQAVGGIFAGLATAVAPLNSQLADTLQQMSDVSNIAASSLSAAASFASGDMVGAATSAANAIQGIITMFAKAKKSAEDAKKAIQGFYTDIYLGEQDILAQERERLRLSVLINKTKMQGLQDEKRLLEEQNVAVKQQFNDVLAALQKESFVAGEVAKKKHGSIFTGLVGYFFGGSTEVQEQLQSLAGKTYDQIEQLFIKGQLTDKAKDLFLQLQKLKQEGVDIDQQLQQLQQEAREALTGTNADAITDMIVQGFANGKRAVQDFGDDIKSIIQKALLQALRYQALEAPIQKIFEQFAADAESGGGLDQTELDSFTKRINQTIEDAAKLAQVLEQQTGVSLSNAQANGATGANSLQGAIKGITEQQAELLAGQFGGQRLATLELVELNKISVSHLNAITVNTANTVERLDRMLFTLRTEGVKLA